ncbi:MAG: AroM family protein [Minisyncoccia bacterium]|jgi:protein AroM|uniref:AroM family protein n=1 Tax=Caldisericum sp. TaxID=2499687 RepID=UPI003C83D191
MRVGFITIGQSPRKDVLDDIYPIIGINFEFQECGALDDLSYEEILELHPANKTDYILVSKLKDGREVTLSKAKIINRMQNCINRLEKNSDIIVLLCTGEFPELKSNKLLIEPSKLLYNTVRSIIESYNKLTIIVPSSTQIEETREKWKYFKNVNIYSISPYKAKEEDYIDLTKKIEKDTDLIAMDCIGYSTKIRKLIKESTGKSVILPRTLVADILRELII